MVNSPQQQIDSARRAVEEALFQLKEKHNDGNAIVQLEKALIHLEGDFDD